MGAALSKHSINNTTNNNNTTSYSSTSNDVNNNPVDDERFSVFRCWNMDDVEYCASQWSKYPRSHNNVNNNKQAHSAKCVVTSSLSSIQQKQQEEEEEDEELVEKLYGLEVTWLEFYNSCLATERRRRQRRRLLEEGRILSSHHCHRHHPSCHSYDMSYKVEEHQKYRIDGLPVKRIREPRDEDYYTSDEESESSSSSSSSSSREEVLSSSSSSSMSDFSSNKQLLIDTNGDDESLNNDHRFAASNDAKEEKSIIIEYGNRMFNPSISSPVFFGFGAIRNESKTCSVEKADGSKHPDDDNVEEEEEEEEEELRCKSLVSSQVSTIENKISDLEALLKQQSIKNEGRLRKLEDKERDLISSIKREQAGLSHNKNGERGVLEKIMEMNSAASTLSLEIEQQKETFRKKLIEKKEVIQEMKNQVTCIHRYESGEFPGVVEVYIKRIELEIEKRTNILEDLVNNLNNFRDSLEAMREEFEMNKNRANTSNLRSMLIAIEGQVKGAEIKVEKAIRDLEDQQMLLKRAIIRKGREEKFCSVYAPLASNNSYCSLVELLITLACISREPFLKKLDIILPVFDCRGSSFVSVLETSLLLRCFNSTMKVLYQRSDDHMGVGEITSFAMKIFSNRKSEKSKLTYYEISRLLLENITRVKSLSVIFNVNWIFSEISLFTKKNMNAITMYELGLLSESELSRKLCKRSLQHLPQLDLSSKKKIHELALARGKDDYTKPDYSIFLPKKKRRRPKGSISPLEHGHLCNVLYVKLEARLTASIHLQRIYRGMNARRNIIIDICNSTFLLAKQHLLKKIKDEALERLELRSSRGFNKLLWHAKTCLEHVRQIGKGNKLSRKEVTSILKEKCTQEQISSCQKGLAMIENHPIKVNKLNESAKEISEWLFSEFELSCLLSFEKYSAYLNNIFGSRLSSEKVRNITLELPSRSLFFRYLESFSTIEALADDLSSRFLFSSKDFDKFDIEQLFHLPDFDIERNDAKRRHERLTQICDQSVNCLAQVCHLEMVNFTERRLNEPRFLSSATADWSVGEKLRLLSYSDAASMSKVKTKLSSQKKELKEMLKDLHVSGVILNDFKRRDDSLRAHQMVTNDKIVDRKFRYEWLDRLMMSLQHPKESMDRHKGVYETVTDFMEIAVSTSLQIISELFLPVEEKAIKPVESTPVDFDLYRGRKAGACCRRHKFELHGIRFKVLLDDHGIFDGSDENAMKLGSHELRMSREYMSENIYSATNAIIPLQATITHHGFRVLAVSNCPLKQYQVNETADDIKVQEADLVMGTNNRGSSVNVSSREVERNIAMLSKKLNIAHHSVRGENDLGPRVIPSSVDLRGYQQIDGKSFYLLNFWRCNPSEGFVNHLPKSPRGMTVFWRMLRPEFVKSYHEPISPDTYSRVVLGVSDSNKHEEINSKATSDLINHRIPSFTADLLVSFAESGKNTISFSAELISRLHSNGINIRHLGLIRSLLWRPLKTTARFCKGSNLLVFDQSFDDVELLTTGSKVRVGDDNYDNFYTVTMKETKESVVSVHLDRRLEEIPSGKNVVIFTGKTQYTSTSDCLRDSILVEMIARTIKNLIHANLRYVATKSSIVLDVHRKLVVVDILNNITGSGEESAKFWNIVVYNGIIKRFGKCSILPTEHGRLFEVSRNHVLGITERLMILINIYLFESVRCEFMESPLMYNFNINDILHIGPIVKQNVFCFDLAKVHVDLQYLIQPDYEERVQNDKPLIYWKLDDPPHSLKALNIGAGSNAFNGDYTGRERNACVGLRLSGECCISKGFHSSKRTQVSTKIPTASYISKGFSIEIWVKPFDSAGINQVIVMMDIFAVIKSREGMWKYVLLHNKEIIISVEGPCINTQKFSYIVCTFDGDSAFMYIDGIMVGKGDKKGSKFDENVHLDNFRRNTLCVGSACCSMSDTNGSSYFDGYLCHIAFYEYCLSFDVIKDHWSIASHSKKDHLHSIDCIDASFHNAIKLSGDKEIVKEYCKFLEKCLSWEEASTHKSLARLKNAARIFKGCKIVDAIAEVLRIVPSNPLYAPIVYELFYDILFCDETYFQAGCNPFSMHDLAKLPHQFFLENNDLPNKKYIQVSAKIFRMVLSETSTSSIFGGVDLSWATELTCDYMLVSIVMASHKGMEKRLDLAPLGCKHVQSNDISVIGKHLDPIEHIALPDTADIAEEALCELIQLSGSSLKSLYIDNSSSSLKGAIVNSIIRYSPNLSSIKLIKMPLPSNVVSELFAFKLNLKKLHLRFCPHALSGGVMNNLSQLQLLEELNIGYSGGIDDKAFTYFCENVNNQCFSSLNIEYCESLTDYGLFAISKYLQTIQELNISGLPHCTDSSVGNILSCCKSLSYMEMNDLPLVTSKSLATIASSALTILKMKHSSINDVGLKSISNIANCCEYLKSLDCSHCIDITDYGMSFILKALSSSMIIEELNVAYCISITDITIKCLVDSNLGSLRSLDISGCFAITNVGIEMLSKGCFKLRKLNVSNCRRLDSDCLLSFQNFVSLSNLNISNCSKLIADEVSLYRLKHYSGIETIIY